MGVAVVEEGFGPICQARMQLLTNPKHKVETLALLLYDNNVEQRQFWERFGKCGNTGGKKRKINYFFNGEPCCHRFFMKVYGINKNICNDIACEVVGDDS